MDNTNAMDNNGQEQQPRKRRKMQTQQRFYNARHGQRLLDYCSERWGSDVEQYPWPRVVAALHADMEWRQWAATENVWRQRVFRASKTTFHKSSDTRLMLDEVRRLTKEISRRVDGTQADAAARIGMTAYDLSQKLNGYERFTVRNIDRIFECFGGDLPFAVQSRTLSDALVDYQQKRGKRVEVTKPAQSTQRPPFQPKPAAEQALPSPQGPMEVTMTSDPVIHQTVCRIVLAHYDRQKPIDVPTVISLAVLLVDHKKAADQILAEIQRGEGLQ